MGEFVVVGAPSRAEEYRAVLKGTGRRSGAFVAMSVPARARSGAERGWESRFLEEWGSPSRGTMMRVIRSA